MPLGNPNLVDRSVIALASMLRIIYKRLKVSTPTEWNRIRKPVHFQPITNDCLVCAVTKPLQSGGFYGFHLITRESDGLKWKFDLLDDRLDATAVITHHAYRAWSEFLLAAVERPGAVADRKVFVYGVYPCAEHSIIPLPAILPGVEIAAMEQDPMKAVFVSRDGKIYVYRQGESNLDYLRTNDQLENMGFTVRNANMITESVLLVEGDQNAIPRLVSLEFSGPAPDDNHDSNYVIRDVVDAPATEALGDKCEYMIGQNSNGFTKTIVSISPGWVRVYHRAGDTFPYRLVRFLDDDMTLHDRFDYGVPTTSSFGTDVTVGNSDIGSLRFELTLCTPTGIRIVRFGLASDSVPGGVVFRKLHDYIDDFPGNARFCFRRMTDMPYKYSLTGDGVVVYEKGYRRVVHLPF
jgi:hypothetical protein